MMMRHLLLTLIGVAAATVLLTSLHFIAGLPRRVELPQLRGAAAQPLHVAILESMGYHDEVTAALAYAFSQHPLTAAKLTLYLRAQRFGIGKVYAGFLPPAGVILPAGRVKDLKQNGTKVDVLVLTTCERDYINHPDVLAHLFNFSRTHLFCVVHHADRMTVNSGAKAEPGSMVQFYAPWIEHKRITFLTLSPHVSTRLLTHVVPTWRNDTSVAPHVETFAPVFPVATPLPGQDASKGSNSLMSVMKRMRNETAFTIQGDFEPTRRSYNAILRRLQAFVRATGSDQTDLTLHLLGNGRGFHVPEALAGHVVIDSGLDYVPFYGVIGQSVAILPAFATEEYYVERASSSVPASLIGGCPLVAERRLLATYGYLDESVVWVQEEDETELDVVLRVALDMSEDERRAKKERVRARTRELCAENVRELVRWASEAREASLQARTYCA